MIAVDTNILVYAHRQDSPWFDAANAQIAALAAGRAAWALPWPCLHEFLSVVTHPRIFRPPTPLERAVQQVDYWLESPSLHLIGETAGYWSHLRRAALAGRLSGPLVHDARIVAICLQNGVSTLWSADRDFSRFPELRVENPLLT